MKFLNILFILIALTMFAHADESDRELFKFCGAMGLLSDSMDIVNSENLSPSNCGIVVSEIIENIENIDYGPGEQPQLKVIDVVKIREAVIKYRSEAEFYTSRDIDNTVAFLDSLKERVASFYLDDSKAAGSGFSTTAQNSSAKYFADEPASETSYDDSYVYDSDMFEQTPSEKLERSMQELAKKHLQHDDSAGSIDSRYANEERRLNVPFLEEEKSPLEKGMFPKHYEASNLHGITGWVEMPSAVNIKAEQSGVAAIIKMSDGPDSTRNFHVSSAVHYGITDNFEIGGTLSHNVSGEDRFQEDDTPDRFFSLKYSLKPELFASTRFAGGYRREIGNDVKNDCFYFLSNTRSITEKVITDYALALNLWSGSRSAATFDLGFELTSPKWKDKASLLAELKQDDNKSFKKFNIGLRFNVKAKLMLYYQHDRELDRHYGGTAVSWLW